MDFRLIQTFLYAYEEKNITRAAERLNIVQPAVSVQLRKFECEVGMPLFERKARGLVPTHAGRAVYEIYQPIMAELKAAQQRVTELTGKTFGRIAVGLTPSVSDAVLAKVLHAFQVKYPDIEADLHEEVSDVLTDMVANGTLDLAIITFTGSRPGIAFNTLVEENLVFIRKSPGAAGLGPPVAYSQALDQKLILPKARQGFRFICDNAAEEIGRLPKPTLEISSSMPIIDLVAKGEHVAIIPSITALRFMNSHGLLLHRVIDPVLTRPLSFIYRDGQKPSDIMIEFAELAQQELKDIIQNGLNFS